MVTKVTTETFESEILKAEGPVLLDCYADWCGPCRMMSPVVDAMAEKFEGQLKVCKLNVDDDGDAVVPYRVMSIPNFLFFKNGEVVKNLVGGMRPADFEAAIREVLG
ncbi:MAG: thioredoxin [Lachnospiraceae bacterium]